MWFFPSTSIYVNFAPLTTNHLFSHWREFIIQLKALIRKKGYFTKVCSFWADNCIDYMRQLCHYQDNWCRLSAVIAMITYSMKYPSVVFRDIRKTAYVRGLKLKDISINPCVVSQTNNQFSKCKGCLKDIFKKFYPSNDLKGFCKKKHF